MEAEPTMTPIPWYLSITEAEFDEIYAGLPRILEQKELFRNEPDTVEEWKGFFLNTKLWRLNNIYWVINKEGILVRFTMNRAQHIKYAKGLRHPRTLVLKSRQRGISTFTLIDYNDDALFINNLTVGMQSYGLNESEVLLEKLSLIWRNLDPNIKKFLGITQTKKNTKAIGYSNGSEVRVQTSFRGDTLHRLHVSELGKIANKDPKKARELKTGTLQAIRAGNPVTVESTAEGQHNAMHEWWYTAVDLIGDMSLKDFYPLFLTWLDDPDCTTDKRVHVSQEYLDELEIIEQDYRIYSQNDDFVLTQQQKWWFAGQRRELGKDFYQEYPHTPESAFNAVHDGTYYARLFRTKGRILVVDTEATVSRKGNIIYSPVGLYDENLDVYVAFDLGLNDLMVLVYFQVYKKELRVIEEYHNHGEGLEHYVEHMRQTGYAIKTVVLPHDINVREYGNKAKTRLTRLRELGVRNTKVLKRSKDVNNDIEQVRKAIPHMIVDGDKADYVVKTMNRYMKKWNDVLGTFDAKPLHNEWSNPADAIRYMVMSGIWSLDDVEVTEPKTVSRPRANI